MKPAVFVLVAVLLWLQYEFWLAPGGVFTLLHLKQNIHAAKMANTRLALRNAVLSADVHDLKSGNEAVEERARTELGMVKKGEIFYQYHS